jgi:two-component sensor histidine kinase
MDIRAREAKAVIDVAMPLGIALVELESNALEHAFPGGRGGTITASLDQESGDYVKIVLSDDGVGPPPGFDPRRDASLGLGLVFALIEQQLKGQVDFDFSSGFRCTLRFGVDYYKNRI